MVEIPVTRTSCPCTQRPTLRIERVFCLFQVYTGICVKVFRSSRIGALSQISSSKRQKKTTRASGVTQGVTLESHKHSPRPRVRVLRTILFPSLLTAHQIPYSQPIYRKFYVCQIESKLNDTRTQSKRKQNYIVGKNFGTVLSKACV